MINAKRHTIYGLFRVSALSTCMILMITSLSAQQEVELRTDGIVVPRTTIEAVTGPTEGMLIYDTSIDAFQYYDGTSWSSIRGAFEREGSLVRQKEGVDTDDFIFGRDALPPSSNISDKMIFFDQSLGAFRGGQIDTNFWRSFQLGLNSFAYGNNVNASGRSATAIGESSIASGQVSTALGEGSIASGNYSTAIGRSITASGIYSTAMGFMTTASKLNSTAIGGATTASGDFSLAMGLNTTASGNRSTAVGDGTTASGFGTTAMGESTVASSSYATALGMYNDSISNNNANISLTDPLLMIGNGDDPNNRSNALVVLKSGTVGVGTNEPTAYVHIEKESSGSAPHLELKETDADGFTRLRFRNTDNFWTVATKTVGGTSTMYFNTNGLSSGDALVLEEGNKAGIGRTPVTNHLEVAGDASKTTAGDWVANSDRRIKTDIKEIDNSFKILEKLRPVKFKYTDEWKMRNPSIKEQYYYNFIAQEYQELFPESVQGSGEYLENDKEEILQIDTYNAQIVTIAAVQELIEVVKEQEVENARLQKQIDEFRLLLMTVRKDESISND